MTRELMLLRHAKSDWTTDVDDVDRPITDTGKRGIQRLGVWLAQQSMQPDFVVSSPAERAWVTTEKTIKAMGRGIDDVVTDERIYDAELALLLAVLSDVPDTAGRTLLVGHNPGLEDLLDHLALAGAPDRVPTGTLIRLTLPDDWSSLGAGCATIEQVVRSRTLPNGFPFPGPDGTETRPRPSYYYTQSAVIPYRFDDAQLQVMVVGSSKKRHLVVPKGIQTPGMTPQESAAKEALEEAGVLGDVGDESLGSYEYVKWGATVTCTVYPMLVTEVVPDADWEERHRGREWLPAVDAAERLKQPELGPMVLALAEQLAG